VDGVVDRGCGLGRRRVLTLTLAFGLLAAAALVAAIVAGMGGSLLAQILAFAIAGGVGLLIVRPLARRADDPSCTGAPSAAFAPIHRTTASSPITGQAACLPQSLIIATATSALRGSGAATAARPEPE
jgi:hypothetical protein